MDSEQRVENGLREIPNSHRAFAAAVAEGAAFHIHRSLPRPFAEPLFHGGSFSFRLTPAPLSRFHVPLGRGSLARSASAPTDWGSRRCCRLAQTGARHEERTRSGRPVAGAPLHSQFLHLTRGGRTRPAAICTSVSCDTRDKWCAAHVADGDGYRAAAVG